jgi:hypothetical protein
MTAMPPASPASTPARASSVTIALPSSTSGAQIVVDGGLLLR